MSTRLSPVSEPTGLRSSVLAFLERFGQVMGTLVLGAMYLILLGPVALISRLLTDPLHRRRPSGSAFAPWDEENVTLRDARRQG